MAIEFSREKESGDTRSVVRPYFLVEKDDPEIDREEAIEIARADAANLENATPTDARWRRISNTSMRVEVIFSTVQLEPLTKPPVGETTIDFQFNFNAKPKFLTEAPEWLQTYNEDGETNEEIRAVNVERTSDGGERVVGREYQPLAEVFAFDVYLPNALLTTEYKQTVKALCGRFNSETFTIDGFDYEPGRVQLVRASGRTRTDLDWRLSFGFGVTENRTNVDVGGGITIPEVRGNWDYWVYQKFLIVNLPGRQFVKCLPDLAVLQRIWDAGDLNLLVPGA